MKILAIGDPHGNITKLKKIPKKNVDLILLTGDLGKANIARKMLFKNIERKKQGLPEIEYTDKQRRLEHMEIHNSTLEVLKYLSKFAPVYTIQGNVGIPTKSDVEEVKEKHGIKLPSTMRALKKMKNVSLIKNRVRVIDGVRIGFLEFFLDTNWVTDFKPNNYKKRMKRAKKQTEKAKSILKKFKNLDIFVFHQPPYGILDKVGPPAPKHWRGKHAGSKTILNYIKKKQPSIAICGHIHEGEGYRKIGKTRVYNLGLCGYEVFEL